MSCKGENQAGRERKKSRSTEGLLTVKSKPENNMKIENIRAAVNNALALPASFTSLRARFANHKKVINRNTIIIYSNVSN